MAGSIPPEFIEELLARVDIVDLIGSRVQLKRTGHNHVGLCPFHKEKTPSFSVSQDKQFYYCFGCQASGDAIAFLVEHDHMDFMQAVEHLAGIAGMEVPRTQSGASEERQRRQKSLFEVLEKACEYYKTQLREHPERDRAVNYLKGRGVTGAVARDFGLGYAPPGWENLTLELAVTNADRQLLIEGGLIKEQEEEKKTYDRFRDRIIFPIRDVRGRVIAFGGRILGDGKPKYLNSPETEIFHKGRELYGLYEARRAPERMERVLLVEGYLDVIALAQHGLRYAVATLGTATSRDHLDRLYRLVPEVIFCFDGDEAGRRAAWKALEEALPLMKDGCSARFLFLPEGEDPDSLIRKEGREAFETRFATALHLPELLFQTLRDQVEIDSLEGKARLSKLAMPLIGQLPEGVLKQLVLDELARITGLERERLLKAVNPHVRAPGAPPPEPPPIGDDARRRRRSPRVTAVDLGISLLLHQPELADRFSGADYAKLKLLREPDCGPLLTLLDLIDREPSPSPAALLEELSDSADAERYRRLANLEQLLPSDQLAAEYEGVIAKLLARAEELRVQAMTKDLERRPFNELSEEERDLIRQTMDARRRHPHG